MMDDVIIRVVNPPPSTTIRVKDEVVGEEYPFVPFVTGGIVVAPPCVILGTGGVGTFGWIYGRWSPEVRLHVLGYVEG